MTTKMSGDLVLASYRRNGLCRDTLHVALIESRISGAHDRTRAPARSRRTLDALKVGGVEPGNALSFLPPISCRTKAGQRQPPAANS